MTSTEQFVRDVRLLVRNSEGNPNRPIVYEALRVLLERLDETKEAKR